MSDQLFLSSRPRTRARERRLALEALDARRARAAAVAASLPAGVHFGTSSWTFPGWAGLVYPPGLTGAALSREGLRHYARHPLLTTVGVDRSYYAPVPIDDLRQYADQLPDGFRCCFKAPAAVTSRLTPTFGGARGTAAPNPAFLSTERLITDLLEPLAAAFLPHTGPIVLEFPPGARDQAQPPAAFLEALDRFLETLPRDFQFAIEIRRQGAAHTRLPRAPSPVTAWRTPTTTGRRCRCRSRRRPVPPGGAALHARCGCCCARAPGTKTSAIASRRSTGSSNPTS
jgi:hypothetical protein